MRLRTTLAIVISLLAGAASPASAAGDDAAAVHRRVLTLDSHVDILTPATPGRYYDAGGGSRSDLPKLIEGGMDAIVYAVAVPPGPRDAAGVAEARKEADYKLAWIKSFVASNPQRVGLALSADDVERLHKEGKIAVLIAFQNARSIGADITQLDVFYKEGARIFALNHAGHNDFSDSSRPWNEPESEHGGLSPLGRDAVKRLNDLGALIDVSQLSTNSLMQTLEITRAPVVATHSDARALFDYVRNLSDAELDAIKANGGVVQVVPYAGYLKPQSAESVRKIEEIRAKYGIHATPESPYAGVSAMSEEQQRKIFQELTDAASKATLTDFVDHIDYIAKRIGWRHVGIGSDFNQGGGVQGFDSEAEAPNVTRELVRRGYTEHQIAAIWGGNFLRVLRAAEAAKAKRP